MSNAPASGDPQTPKVPRIAVVQGLLDLYREPAYLEVGVATGATFHGVSANRKVAVDPRFLFDVEARRSTSGETNVVYHQMPSDQYFGSLARHEQFDVIFLDGLHTSEQTLRDLLNAVFHLSPQGVIVIDDVVPQNYSSSLVNRRDAETVRAARGEKKCWMGDVYRLAFFIETFLQQFEYRTTSDNHGQIIMWRQTRPSVGAGRTLMRVALMEYSSIFTTPQSFRFAPYRDILAEVRATLDAGAGAADGLRSPEPAERLTRSSRAEEQQMTSPNGMLTPAALIPDPDDGTNAPMPDSEAADRRKAERAEAVLDPDAILDRDRTPEQKR